MSTDVITKINPFTHKEEKYITMEINDHIGSAEIIWREEDFEGRSAHYEALISVPFKDCRSEHLFIYDKCKFNDAVEEAKDYLRSALLRCTLC